MHQLLKITLDCPENNWNNSYGDEVLYAAHRLEKMRQARNRTQQAAHRAGLAFDAHSEIYRAELNNFLYTRRHRGNAASLEDEFGGYWLKRTQQMTKDFGAALATYLSADRDYERAKAFARVQKLKNVKLDPLQ
jgi:hypothetical protein